MRRPKEIAIPAALLIAGVVLLTVHAVANKDAAGVGMALGTAGVRLVMGVVLGVIACLFTAALLGTSFGSLWGAVLKLAAIAVFPLAGAMLFPYVGWILLLFVDMGLILWLFDLTTLELAVLVVTLWVLQLLALFSAGLVVAGVLGV